MTREVIGRRPSPAGERVLAILVALYPADFRARFGAEMRQCFRDQYAVASRYQHNMLWYWLRAGADLALGAVAERLARLIASRRSALAVGAAGGGGTFAAGSALYCLCCVAPTPFGQAGVQVAAELYGYRDGLLATSLGVLALAFWLAHAPAPATSVAEPVKWRRLARASANGGASVWTVALFAPWLVSRVHAH